jgi:class 3 adenylate cyclase/pimeloyl-ACP methyl ester carboxylesterase
MERRLAAIMAADVVGYSRLMSRDELGTLATLQTHRSELITPTLSKHRGRIVKLMGDGILIEFGSVVDAVEAAAEIQLGMGARNSGEPAERQMLFRIGIHVGDVMVEGDDLYGDGVNIAARLEGIAEAGGICISRQAFDQVEGKLALIYRRLGLQNLKNIERPVEAYSINLGKADSPAPRRDGSDGNQVISFCRARDGVRLAYAKVGQGPPLVKTANWMNHLEYDWESPIWRHFLRELASGRRLIRYDARGNGLSDWDVDDISFEAWVTDLEAVVDAAGLERFPLLGISQGCSISIAYAIRHPERVSHLILYGGFARGRNHWPLSAQEREKFKAMTTLMGIGWGEENPTFRQMFTSLFIPGGTKEQGDWFNELQRKSTSAECAVRYFTTVADIDVRPLLPLVDVPTLVMHVRGDAMVPFDLGREMAAGIKGARFVAMQGRNHIFLEDEPASDRFIEEVRLFLGDA